MTRYPYNRAARTRRTAPQLLRLRHWQHTLSRYGPRSPDRLLLWSIYPRAKALNAQYGGAYWRTARSGEVARFRSKIATPLQRGIRQAHYRDGAISGYDSKG